MVSDTMRAVDFHMLVTSKRVNDLVALPTLPSVIFKILPPPRLPASHQLSTALQKIERSSNKTKPKKKCHWKKWREIARVGRSHCYATVKKCVYLELIGFELTTFPAFKDTFRIVRGTVLSVGS